MKHRRHRIERATEQAWKGSAPPACHTGLGSRAFTLVECLAVMAALALLACVAVPVLAGTKSDSQRILCVNNLRQVGQAWAGWKNEHGDRTPPFVNSSEGGIGDHPLRQNAWVHYATLSNHLATPRPLSCPADLKAVAARDWSGNPGTGFIQPAGLGDRAVSYLVGLHGQPEYPGEIIGGDFDISGMVFTVCGRLGSLRCQSLSGGDASVGWTNYSHLGTGNLLLNDGQVRQTTSEQLRAVLESPGRVQTNETHLLVPNR